MVGEYVPERGDVVWLTFDLQAGHGPQAGHEQAGRRPAITISPRPYNGRVGLGLFCPVTTRIRGYPFEVPIPVGLPVEGVVLADQVKSIDWRARRAQPAGELPANTVAEIIARVAALIA